MPWSGSSPNQTFSRTTGLQIGASAWQNTEAAGRGIQSVDADTHDQDIADAINAALKKDGGNKPTADIDWNAKKITNLGDPTSPADAANKGYVDDAVANTVNATVRAATTGNITIATALNNGGSLDGLTLATSDRVLVKDQTDAEENGVYVVGVTPARATDFDTFAEHVGSIINVSEGTTNGGRSYRCTANAGGTLGVTDINYVQFGTNVTLPLGISSGGTGQTSAAAAFNALKQNATDTDTGVVEKATAAEVRSATADKYVSADLIETASAIVALTETAGAVAVDWDTFINGEVTVDEATVISNPTNGQPGTTRIIVVKGNNTTDRTITFGNQFLGEVPTITDCDSDRWYLLTILCWTTTHFIVSAKRAKG